MWRQQGRHKTGTTGGNSLHPTQQWMGNITEWSGYGYVEATRKAQDRNYWWQLIAPDPAMDGEHNRVDRVWLCGGNKEGTRQELLAATHCIRPSNRWNLTMMTTILATGSSTRWPDTFICMFPPAWFVCTLRESFSLAAEIYETHTA